jgi:hypothetical protein
LELKIPDGKLMISWGFCGDFVGIFWGTPEAAHARSKTALYVAGTCARSALAKRLQVSDTQAMETTATHYQLSAQDQATPGRGLRQPLEGGAGAEREQNGRGLNYLIDVLEAVTTRFGDIPADVTDAVRRLETRDMLHALLRQALTCPTIEAFGDALQAARG